MQDEKVSAGEKLSSEAHDLAELGVAAAVAAIRDGDITSESYSAALLKRARAFSELNSFITIDESAVLAAARDADKARAAGSTAPLLGVPFGIKDSYATRGLRTTIGTAALRNFVPVEDAEIVGAIRVAGGIVFGKNNLVEMSYGLTGNNGNYGQVKNPYNHGHISGGSSSGSGASVAARIVPAAFGGDSVGSIRVPASLCGVVGFKPTTGRWPRKGVAPISHTLDTTGILARSVEDCELIDRIVAKDTSSARSDRSDLKGAKFAYAPRQYLELIDPVVEASFNNALRRLRDAGAQMIEVDLGDDFFSLAEQTTWNIFFHETMQEISGFVRENNFPVSFDEIYAELRSDIKDVWDQFVLPGSSGFLSSAAYTTALSVDLVELRRRFDGVFVQSGAEAFIFPTTPCTAPSIEQQSAFTIAGKDVNQLALAKNTVPTSAAGLPGISIPMGLTSERLPIGLEIDGARGHDRALLDLARRVQATIGVLPASL
ncbi:amidase family protein [Paraburkholderia sp. BCC1885]|uniref:amidase family protein n=1 Tax=Paraburkholderia sp. BCC1885 TaxID=2562669 RepID=UPI00118453CE|nr:amidase family protein [Paraburkholderia sp. BCC1885]